MAVDPLAGDETTLRSPADFKSAEEGGAAWTLVRSLQAGPPSHKNRGRSHRKRGGHGGEPLAARYWDPISSRDPKKNDPPTPAAA
jgi:hypothetical protein